MPCGTSEKEGGKRCAEMSVIPPVVQLGALRHSRIKCSAHSPAVQYFFFMLGALQGPLGFPCPSQIRD